MSRFGRFLVVGAVVALFVGAVVVLRPRTSGRDVGGEEEVRSTVIATGQVLGGWTGSSWSRSGTVSPGDRVLALSVANGTARATVESVSLGCGPSGEGVGADLNPRADLAVLGIADRSSDL